MKHRLQGLSRIYRAALQTHLKQGPQAGLQDAQSLGRKALSLGLETLDMARIHEDAINAMAPMPASPGSHNGMVRRARVFFAEAIVPIEKTHRIVLEATVHLGRINHALRRHSLNLAASSRELKREIVKRKSAQESLKKSERHYGQLLEQSRNMQEQLRLLSRQLFSAQEEERKKISRELHDVIAQTLTGINVRLAILKKEAADNKKGIESNIARTQELVERSVNIVHRFARELRPTVLDDLGLIPAIHTFLKNFREETGIQVSLSAAAAVEELSGDKRTVLFRVAQEALNNISRHAKATQVTVQIQKLEGMICMRIKDNGRGFQENPALPAKRTRRLGLLGMRERLEMVGGRFKIQSVVGRGTTVIAQVPLMDHPAKGTRAPKFKRL